MTLMEFAIWFLGFGLGVFAGFMGGSYYWHPENKETRERKRGKNKNDHTKRPH